MKRFTLILLAVIAVTFSAMAQSEKPKMVLGLKSHLQVQNGDGAEWNKKDNVLFVYAIFYQNKIQFMDKNMENTVSYEFIESWENNGYWYYKKTRSTFFIYHPSGESAAFIADDSTIGLFPDEEKTQELKEFYGI